MAAHRPNTASTHYISCRSEKTCRWWWCPFRKGGNPETSEQAEYKCSIRCRDACLHHNKTNVAAAKSSLSTQVQRVTGALSQKSTYSGMQMLQRNVTTSVLLLSMAHSRGVRPSLQQGVSGEKHHAKANQAIFYRTGLSQPRQLSLKLAYSTLPRVPQWQSDVRRSNS